jgi:hypothetical protein
MCAHAYITCGVTNEPRIRANVCVCSRTPSRPSQHACFRRAAGSDGWAHGASACSVHANARASSLRRPARKQKARRRRGACWRRSVDRENGISRTRDGTRISPIAGLAWGRAGLLVYVGSFRRGQPRSAASSAAGAWVGMSGAGSRRHLDSVRSRRWTGRGPMVSKLDVSDPTVETGKDCMSLGLDDREIDVLTRKRPNRVHRVPTCDDDDLDPVADLDGLHLAPRNPSALSRRGLTDVQSIRGTRRPALILQPEPSTDARPSEHCRIRQRRRTAAGRRLSALSPHGACQGRLACATTSGHCG